MAKNVTQAAKLLLVDDDPYILEVLEARLMHGGFAVRLASNAEEALGALKDDQIHLMISDVRMPGKSGMDLLREALQLCPGLPVIILTAHGSIADAVEAVKAGAVDYLTKPFSGTDLIHKVEEILKRYPHPAVCAPELTPLNEVLFGGNSPATKELYDLIDRVAPRDVNVLITGESGAGKELVARLIHSRGPRREFPFIVVDCGSTPTSLLESELFGHVRGSFTHAVRDKKGLIEAAHLGTLFLDEIGNISSEMQMRLLRFLEDRKIRRIGDVQEIEVNCRVIAATNLDLPAAVKAGDFREDLYYRLRVVTLRIPPLRERPEDIPLIAQRFVEKFCAQHNRPSLNLSPESIDWMLHYPWPGNVRELKNALEAAIVLAKDDVLQPSDLEAACRPQGREAPAESDRPLTIEESERSLILRALEQANWVQKDAAERLGISRRALHYKLKKFGIQVSRLKVS